MNKIRTNATVNKYAMNLPPKKPTRVLNLCHQSIYQLF